MRLGSPEVRLIASAILKTLKDGNKENTAAGVDEAARAIASRPTG